MLPTGNLLPGDSELTETYNLSRTVLRDAPNLRRSRPKDWCRRRRGSAGGCASGPPGVFFDPDVLVCHARTGFYPDLLIHLCRMRRLAAPGISPDGFISADLGLHVAIAEVAGSLFFRSISALIEVAVLVILNVAPPTNDPGKLAASVADHRAIVEAIEASNLDAPRAAMRAVLLRRHRPQQVLAIRGRALRPDRAAPPSEPA